MAYEDALKEIGRRMWLEEALPEHMEGIRAQARHEREFAAQVVAAYAGATVDEVTKAAMTRVG